MINDNNEEPIDPGLRRLYVHMTDDQVREAQRNLRRYHRNHVDRERSTEKLHRKDEAVVAIAVPC